MTGICGYVLDIFVYLDMTTFSGLTIYDLGPSPLSFEKSKLEDIDRERIVVFYWYLAPRKLDCELAIECLCS